MEIWGGTYSGVGQMQIDFLLRYLILRKEEVLEVRCYILIIIRAYVRETEMGLKIELVIGS